MSFIFQVTNYPIRTIKTILLGALLIGVGLYVSILGPALLDLQMLADVNLQQTAALLPSRSFGNAMGSMIAGVLGDRGMDHQILIMVSLFFAIVTSICFPIFHNIIAMYILVSIGGIANGSVNTMANVWVIHLWGKENPPFMQILHLFWGIGSFIAPFIVEPFLTTPLSDDSLAFGLKSKEDYTKIMYPFFIVAAYNFMVLIGFAVIYYIYPDNPIHPSFKSGSNNELASNKKDKLFLKKQIDGLVKIFVIVISTLALHAYVGIEISFGSLLPSFAVKSNLHMTKSEGSFITSTYWGMFTFLRIFSFIAVIYVSPSLLLLIDFGIIMTSNLILVPFANKYRWALWTGSALMGLGCSNVFGTVFAFLGQMTAISGRMTAGFMIASCAGEFIIPLLVSYYIDTEPSVFLWVIFFYSSLSFICILILLFIHYTLLKKQRNEGIEFPMSIVNPAFECKSKSEDKI